MFQTVLFSVKDTNNSYISKFKVPTEVISLKSINLFISKPNQLIYKFYRKI